MRKATTTMKKRNPESLRGKEGKGGDSPSQPRKGSGPSAGRLIDARIKELSDWRGETLARVRILIKQAHPEAVEELKWVKPTNPGGVPVWSHAGMICTGETYKNVVKMTFSGGASLDDPSGLFNSSRNRTANGCKNEKSAIGSQCHSDPFQDETWGFGGPIAPVLKPGSPDKRREI